MERIKRQLTSLIVILVIVSGALLIGQFPMEAFYIAWALVIIIFVLTQLKSKTNLDHLIDLFKREYPDSPVLENFDIDNVSNDTQGILLLCNASLEYLFYQQQRRKILRIPFDKIEEYHFDQNLSIITTEGEHYLFSSPSLLKIKDVLDSQLSEVNHE